MSNQIQSPLCTDCGIQISLLNAWWDKSKILCATCACNKSHKVVLDHYQVADNLIKGES